MEILNFLLDQPVVLLIGVLIGAPIGVFFERIIAKADSERRNIRDQATMQATAPPPATR